MYTTTHAQVKPEAVERLMKHRMYTCFEVEYNAILLAQEHYEMGRFDTLDAIIDFWKSHCEMNERLFSIGILNSIRNNKLKEFISSREFLAPKMIAPKRVDSDLYRPQVLRMLTEYKQAVGGTFSDKTFHTWSRENYSLPKDVNDYYTFYEDYYDFLRFMARSMAGKRTYSPLESFLLRFYAAPDSVQYAEIDSAVYQGTVLHSEYQKYKKYDKEIHGASYGMQVGTWMPYSKLAHLGNHPYFAFNFGGKSYTTAWDCILGVRINKSPNSYTVFAEDSLFTTNKFTGWYGGLDLAHKLWQRKKHQFDFVWGIGYEAINTLSVDLDTTRTTDDPLTQSMGSAYLNVGLAYRLYVRNKIKDNRRKHSYLSLQGRYYMADFKNPGGTDLHGNYLTIGLVYGAYSHDYTKYPVLK